MNKNTLILVLSFLLLPSVMWSCSSSSDDKDEPIPTSVSITASPASLSADYEGATLDLAVTSTADWSIRSDQDWCTVSPSGGSKNQPTTVKVKVSASSESESRTATLTITSSGNSKSVAVTQASRPTLSVSSEKVILSAKASDAAVTLETNLAWSIDCSDSWLSVSPSQGNAGTTTLTISADENDTDSTRDATITITADQLTKAIKVEQMSDDIATPDGYTLVWHDEFNEGTVPGPDWVLENWAAGYVNNELQTYTSHEVDGKRTAEIKDGFLYINCFKGSDGKIYSARMNALPSTGWLYGYFEARINLPKGKGTWPAYWMMPCNVDWDTNPWPKCGEIDIMEEVGADPNQVSSSLHTQKYNHTLNTQFTHSMYCSGAEGEFHIYALEWSEDAITTYVDGKVQLQVTKAQMGSDHDSWPFHYAFYPILNLAWGGDWGGYKGVDDAALPVSMLVDYIRIFQKN